MRIAGLCDKDTAVGLRLAGIRDVWVDDGNALSQWLDITKREDIALVFITEAIADQIHKHLNDYRIRNTRPIVIEIPDKNGRKKDHVDFVSHLIKKAVGIEVKK